MIFMYVLLPWFPVCVQTRDVARKTRKTVEETLSSGVLLIVLKEASDIAVCVDNLNDY